MSKRILVVGLQLNDAGKTTLCKALIHGFKETGVALVPFKPHSGIVTGASSMSFKETAAHPGEPWSSKWTDIDSERSASPCGPKRTATSDNGRYHRT